MDNLLIWQGISFCYIYFMYTMMDYIATAYQKAITATPSDKTPSDK
jgi:hypothetical protein